MRLPHGCHAGATIEPMRPGDLYRAGRQRHPLPLRRASLREACLLQNFGPALPSSRALLFSNCGETSIQNVLIWVKRPDLPCARRMADMSVPALLESLPAYIFNLSLRRRTASSSRGPVFPRHEFEPNPPPSASLNGKRRFLLPRPFATTFIGLHLRMEPFFCPQRLCERALSGSIAQSKEKAPVGRSRPLRVDPEQEESLVRSSPLGSTAQSERKLLPPFPAWLAFRLRVCRTRRRLA